MIKLTYEDLNEVMGFNITDDGFFSEGVVIMVVGTPWELVEVVGDQLLFVESNDVETAVSNTDFFYSRAE